MRPLFTKNFAICGLVLFALLLPNRIRSQNTVTSGSKVIKPQLEVQPGDAKLLLTQAGTFWGSERPNAFYTPPNGRRMPKYQPDDFVIYGKVKNISSEMLETRTQPPAKKTLGISDSQAMAKFNAIDNFELKESPLLDGRKRRLGKARTAILELIGDPSNLEQITISVMYSNEDQQSTLTGAANLLMLPSLVDPTWSGASDWMRESIQRIANGETCVTTVNGITYEMTAVNEIGMISLTASKK